MLKLIFKNLWSRKGKSLWLFIELVIVTIVAWATIDAVVVNSYIKSMPLGYDMSRYVVLTLNNNEMAEEEGFDEDGVERTNAALRRVVSSLKLLPEVEGASRFSGEWLESGSMSCTTLDVDSTKSYSIYIYNLYPGWDTFALLGMKSVGRSPSTEELVNLHSDSKNMILSESAAKLLFGESDATGKVFKAREEGDNDIKVIGVVSDIRHHSPESDAISMYRLNSYAKYDYYPRLLVRLKEGESAQKFVNTHREEIEEQINGGIKLYEITTLEAQSAKYRYGEGYTNSMRLRYALLLFFMINIGLGMTGTFLLQTRKRTEEAGIMLSFGATKGFIMRMLLGEGFVLTTISWLVGCGIFYHIAKLVGLAMGLGDTNVDCRVPVEWIGNFNLHFAIISLIVLAILLAVVMLGIWIPARKISSVNPVNALRDE